MAETQTGNLRLAHVEDLGGEGLIIRKPDALYAAGRSTEILKNLIVERKLVMG